jgi:hypothetical protein
MIELICKHCGTELTYNDDLDESGIPFCTCTGAELDRTAKLLVEVFGEMSVRAARIRKLEGVLEDWDNLLLHAMDGREDEVHCTCCAPLRARVAQLEAALGALVNDDYAGVYDDYYCAYCTREAVHDTDPIWHDASCPIEKGRKLLEPTQ